ncbi:microfibril-associated glycoprotein 4-like [Haliotis cracherodii]|uniref:microfibril-associated glycoprotein 4-like n=1 Tax=Haliotis cracherodii TaxID=6455 RepID=UPI0039E9E828
MATLSMFAIVTLFLHYNTTAGDHTNIISKTYSECTQFISPINETVVEDMHGAASCAVQCVTETRCVAFSVSATDDMCMLHREMFLTGICYSGNWRHYNVQNRCMNGGEYNQEKLTCQCYGGYIGQFCERIMQDCTEGYKTGHYTSGSGIYLIQPNIAPTPFKVKCLMQHGGYTHAQQRNYGSADFYRSWQEYKDGFGDLSKDFWLGNDKIGYITNGRNQTLSFVSRDMSTTFTRQRMYTSFTLSQDGLYRMTFERTWGHTNPDKSGGDCLSELKGQPFSTFDHDNDDSTLNCAKEHQSGFWFKNCTPCNPNGVWSDTPDGKRAGIPEEMFWIPVTGDNLLLSCTIYLQGI